MRVVVVTTQPHNPLPDVGGTATLDWRPFDETRADGGLGALFAHIAVRLAESNPEHDMEVLQNIYDLPEHFDRPENELDADIISDWIDSETDCWVSETAQSVLIVKARPEGQE